MVTMATDRTKTMEVDHHYEESQAEIALRKAIESSGTFPKNGPDPSVRSWGHSNTGITFAAQNQLPKQPLPNLESSCGRYLQALRPLQSDEEHARSQAAVSRFLEGEGPILQTQLETYDKSHTNYFEHFCYDSFLADESPVVLNSNAFCAFEDDPYPWRNEQVIRATSLVRSALAFAQAIREDRLQPDTVRGTPMCMNQYWWLFGAARIPGVDGGRLRLDPDSRHIVVLCRGQIYHVNVIGEDTNQIIGEDELATCLESIVKQARTRPLSTLALTSIGLLTTENQRVWSRCRRALEYEGLQNGRNLSTIDSSLFALCLDESVPETPEAICKNMICGTDDSEDGVQVGTCVNRWYDKLSIIVCRNGKAGMNFEHTCSDGSVDIRMACDIYTGSLLQPKTETDGIEDKALTNGALKAVVPNLRQFEWDIPEGVKTALKNAESHLQTRIRDHQLATLNVTDQGKAFITSAGFSPDAYFQMALQAAYYSINVRVGNAFEPVVTRQYLHGRTDVVRSATPEAALFAQLFNSENASDSKKLHSLQRATQVHTAKVKDCAGGLSHHRHLYILHQMWKRRRAFLDAAALCPPQANGTKSFIHEAGPTIFTDPGWSRLGTTILMGSNVENADLAYAGFGPPSEDGFTICYYIRKDQMAMSINSRNGKAKQLGEAIERTFQGLKRMIYSKKDEKSSQM